MTSKYRESDKSRLNLCFRMKSNAPTDWISQHCLVITWPSKRICSSELVHAAVWTVIRADKRSVWRDSNESCGFVPLLAHKHYIEHFSNFSYRFRGKLYRDNYRYRIIAQPYLTSKNVSCRSKTSPVLPGGTIFCFSLDSFFFFSTSLSEEGSATRFVYTQWLAKH